MKKVIAMVLFGLVLGFNSVAFAQGQKIIIPDQVQDPVIDTGDFRALVKSVHARDISAGIRMIIKCEIGYNVGGGVFAQIGAWKDVLKYVDIVDDPETPEDETSNLGTECNDEYKTGNTAFKTFLQNNLPAGWPEPQ